MPESFNRKKKKKNQKLASLNDPTSFVLFCQDQRCLTSHYKLETLANNAPSHQKNKKKTKKSPKNKKPNNNKKEKHSIQRSGERCEQLCFHRRLLWNFLGGEADLDKSKNQIQIFQNQANKKITKKKNQSKKPKFLHNNVKNSFFWMLQLKKFVKVFYMIMAIKSI